MYRTRGGDNNMLDIHIRSEICIYVNIIYYTNRWMSSMYKLCKATMTTAGIGFN